MEGKETFVTADSQAGYSIRTVLQKDIESNIYHVLLFLDLTVILANG